MVDFQAIYQLNVLDVLVGRLEPSRVLDLIDGLLYRPDSVYRAQYLNDHPQEKDPARDPRLLGYLGWSQDTRVLLGIHNVLTVLTAGKNANDHMLKPPGDDQPGRRRLVAQTLAEFTETGFFEQMAQLERQQARQQ